MQRAGQPYYAALLTAAQYHGAAHHRPQEFQVMLAKSRRPLHCGSVRVAFFVRERLREVFLQSFNTPRGPIQVSSPETTAVDLVGYQHQIGGLDQVATIVFRARGPARCAEVSQRCADSTIAMGTTTRLSSGAGRRRRQGCVFESLYTQCCTGEHRAFTSAEHGWKASRCALETHR